MGTKLVATLLFAVVAACGGEVVETSRSAPPEIAPPPSPPKEEAIAKEQPAPKVEPGSCDYMKNLAGPGGGRITFHPESSVRISHQRVVAEDFTRVEKNESGRSIWVRRLNLRFDGGPEVRNNPEGGGGVCVSAGSATWALVAIESESLSAAAPELVAVGEYPEHTIYGGDYSSTCCETGRGSGVGGSMQITNAKVTITSRTETFIEGKIETTIDGVRSELATFRVPFATRE